MSLPFFDFIGSAAVDAKTMAGNENKIQFTNIHNASLPAEWFFFIIGAFFLIISIFGNGYVSYRLIKIVRMSKAIQVCYINFGFIYFQCS